jgi:hypothetical protein
LDANDETLALNSEILAHQEALYAAHLSLNYIYYTCPRYGKPLFNFSRTISHALGSMDYTCALVKLKMDPNGLDWVAWNKIRSLVGHSSRLKVGILCADLALELSYDKPLDEYLARWTAEMVQIIIIPSIFFKVEGDSMLPQWQCDFLQKFKVFATDIRVIPTLSYLIRDFKTLKDAKMLCF